MLSGETEKLGKLVVATRDAKVAESALTRQIGPHTLRPIAGAHAIDVACYTANLGALSLHRLSYGAPVVLEVPPMEQFFLLQLTLFGRCSCDSSAGRFTIDAGSISIANPNQFIQKRWDANTQQLLIKIDRTSVERHVVAETGANIGPVLFDQSPRPLHSSAALAGMIGMMCNDLQHGGLLSEKRDVMRHVSSAFLSLLLHLFPWKGKCLLDRATSSAAPRFVRQAEHFIQTHFRDDIGLDAIAAAAGVSIRSITKGFRDFRGTTAMNYLRDLRLDIARRDLMEHDTSSTTISSAARKAGIRHLGRFSQDYLDRFAELPSQTLRGPRLI